MGYDNNNSSGPFVNITGLWRSKDGQGLNGSLGAARIIIYKNKYKKEDRHPDYMLAVVEREKDNNRGGGGNRGGYNNNQGGGGGYNQGGGAPQQPPPADNYEQRYNSEEDPF